jgi:hypothetical protein
MKIKPSHPSSPSATNNNLLGFFTLLYKVDRRLEKEQAVRDHAAKKAQKPSGEKGNE